MTIGCRTNSLNELRSPFLMVPTNQPLGLWNRHGFCAQQAGFPLVIAEFSDVHRAMLFGFVRHQLFLLLFLPERRPAFCLH